MYLDGVLWKLAEIIENTRRSNELHPGHTVGIQQMLAVNPTTFIYLHPLSSHILQMTKLKWKSSAFWQ